MKKWHQLFSLLAVQRNKKGKYYPWLSVVLTLKHANEFLGKILLLLEDCSNDTGKKLFLLKDRGITYSMETCVEIIGGHGINLEKISELQ